MIYDILHSVKDFINPETIIEKGGLFLLCFIIFAETGLFVGFFLPGDSLLFLAGFLASPGKDGMAPMLDYPLWIIIGSVALCAIIGNWVGYAFGSYMGPKLFNKEDSLIFKKKYLTMMESFYARNGAMALIAGRFVPIIRTFVPILAGAIKLDYRKFLIYNVLGALAWVISMVMIGYILGRAFPWLKQYLELIVLGLILVTAIPVVRTYLRERKLQAQGEKKA